MQAAAVKSDVFNVPKFMKTRFTDEVLPGQKTI